MRRQGVRGRCAGGGADAPPRREGGRQKAEGGRQKAVLRRVINSGVAGQPPPLTLLRSLSGQRETVATDAVLPGHGLRFYGRYPRPG
jgi:hypothetical protein